MAWWDHEELKSPADRSDRYIVEFPGGYSKEVVQAATLREAAKERGGYIGLRRDNPTEQPAEGAVRAPKARQSGGADTRDTSTDRWKGIHKLTEECGEVLQVVGKINVFPDGDHPDGGPPLRQRLEEELADLEAAIIYVRQSSSL